ncbi:MAG: CrcB family protein [Spirochaetes bacterium]|nr:CrcB family protein [Spirochaetota bacterium]
MPDFSIYSLFLVFVGGGLGSMLRFAIGKFSLHYFGVYPYGTLAANILGALLAGIASVIIYERQVIHPPYNDFVLAGFLGGLTTFSSMILDAYRLAEHRMLWVAALYIFLNVILGLVLFGLAHHIARAA